MLLCNGTYKRNLLFLLLLSLFVCCMYNCVEVFITQNKIIQYSFCMVNIIMKRLQMFWSHMVLLWLVDSLSSKLILYTFSVDLSSFAHNNPFVGVVIPHLLICMLICMLQQYSRVAYDKKEALCVCTLVPVQTWPLVTFTAIFVIKIQHFCLYILEGIIS